MDLGVVRVSWGGGGNGERGRDWMATAVCNSRRGKSQLGDRRANETAEK